jgi:hypothetical protein
LEDVREQIVELSKSYNKQLQKITTLQGFIDLVKQAFNDYCYPAHKRQGIIIESIEIHNDKIIYLIPFGNILYRNKLNTLKKTIVFIQKDKKHRDENCIIG